MIKEKAMKHGIEVSLGIEQADDLRIHTDERAFRQIMFNLLSNAARFTPDNGAIEVEAKKTGDEVFISVLDTGIGIDEKYHSRIFEEFYQVQPKSGLQSQGTGLGLSLARKLVNMHGGKIWVESRGEKYGTIVVFTMKAA
jgi:signal transduction histidine kinase